MTWRDVLVATTVSFVVLATPSSVSAQTIASRTDTTPFAGVRLVTGRTTSPTTTFHAALVSLCTDYVHVAADAPTTTLRRTSTWAASRGVQLATNGDFFTATGPRVYGDTVGNGVRWPLAHTGVDPAVADQWYYRRYGWIAFGPNWVEFDHTEYVKEHPTMFGAALGWYPSTVTNVIPRGTVSLVSGFPELVTEGRRYTCTSPTASSCFPDRTDMRTRNPRTAMGLTRDRRTFILATVDGRSTTSVGMYGSELARLMELLGAWQAFNIDGGGSTTMWQQGRGVINAPSDGVERVVYDHWGIFAGAASGQARAAGSCFTPGGCFPTTVDGAEAETFHDVLPTASGAREIAAVYGAHLDNGCQTTPTRFFCPNCRVTRRAIVHMLVRGLGLDVSHPPASATFSDVPTTDANFAEIEAAVRAGWIGGCATGRFCPAGAITRAQASALVRRAMAWPADRPARASFADVPATDANFVDVESMKSHCISGGCGSGNFCPTRYMVRWEAAAFVARALDLNDVNACLGVMTDGGVAMDASASGDAGIEMVDDVLDPDPDDASLEDDAGPEDDVPEFVNDAERGEMPDAIDGGCGCRVANASRADARTRFAFAVGAMVIASRTRRRRRFTSLGNKPIRELVRPMSP